MSKIKNPHLFHIPVMGIAFTIDTPIRVAHYGISAAISLVDDILAQQMNQFHSEKNGLPFENISARVDDFRAKRMTAYLNTVKTLTERNLENLKESIINRDAELDKYLQILPHTSELRANLLAKLEANLPRAEFKTWLDENLPIGSIDVNIMTKLDKSAISKGEARPDMYRDAHSSLRGFAESDIDGAMVFSAGMNPRLYSYCETFSDFYPQPNAPFKKRIILKVSDYRSAIIQGKFFAKKGLWVSEYRVESGLNCGGHAFATDGNLMGPILEEFKRDRQELINTTFEMYRAALETKGFYCPDTAPAIRITAQGGIGENFEHEFLINHFGVESTGWGTPFLLSPEVTTVDETTRRLLAEAKEKDLYLSDISPLGVRFNSLRTNTKDDEMRAWIAAGTPGSPCPKRYASTNTEFTKFEICTASRQYQRIKLDELKEKNLSPEKNDKALVKIFEKSCICVGLGTPALINNGLSTKVEGLGVSICPGPNMAYFSQYTTLAQMAGHIYGSYQVPVRKDRPNLFLKELSLYVDYFYEQLGELEEEDPNYGKAIKQLTKFRNNLNGGIEFYVNLFSEQFALLNDTKEGLLEKLDALAQELNKPEIAAKKKLEHSQVI